MPQGAFFVFEKHRRLPLPLRRNHYTTLTIATILGLLLGIWLLRKYDFAYKINFKLLIAGLIAAILLTVWTIDTMGLDDILLHGRQGYGQSH
jgi:hypothetical protein